MSATDPTVPSDDDIVRLAQAERDAGVPDVQVAQAAAEAEKRLAARNGEIDSGAHPS
ncbi:hypothetical protein [uncultured Sphingomonas sp.]|uniref:hypothetical protein n=1 Tax=uncultured Sphingomonas sp. TaxID=158754 RepID=UPI0035CAA653